MTVTVPVPDPRLPPTVLVAVVVSVVSSAAPPKVVAVAVLP